LIELADLGDAIKQFEEESLFLRVFGDLVVDGGKSTGYSFVQEWCAL
jgi:hypothetical protein